VKNREAPGGLGGGASGLVASRKDLGMRALRALPPLGWTAVIWWLSTDSWSATETSLLLLPMLGKVLPWATPEQLQTLHWLARKAAHATEYGVLASLWCWTLGRGAPRRPWVVPLILSIVTAGLDELHQAMTLGRTASAADVVLDSAGAGAALIWLTSGLGVLVQSLTGVLLWTAAAGGTALIALDLSAGVPAGWLWCSTPAAWIALALWRRRARPR
jgi:VanZ family protein